MPQPIFGIIPKWYTHHCSEYSAQLHLCLPLSVQANCANVAAARLMSKQLQWIQDIEVGTGQIVLPYGMPDKQYQKEAVYIYITHQKCNTCMTSKLRGIFRPTQQSMITKEHSHRNKSSKNRTRIKTNWPNRGGGGEVEVKQNITNLHGIRRKWNGPNINNYPACFAVGLPQVKIGVEGFENRLIK